MFRPTRVVAAVTLAAATFSFSVATAEAAPPSSYTVVSGDSLYGISQKLGVRFNDLLAANGLTASSVILPGQTLAVPGGAPATPATPASGGSYTVKAGDSLGRIATKHGVSLSALLSINGMTATSLILPGQVLTLPAGATTGSGSSGAPAAPAAPSGATYTVVAGDSLGRIASRHGVSLPSLLAVNSMTVKSLILPGQVIQLPAGASTPTATPTPPSTAPAAGGTYTVKAGDSLGRIANKHGVTLRGLLDVNGMTASSLILPGQVLSLPAGATTPTAQPTDTTSSSAGIAKVIEFALAQQGKPYAFATSGPDTYDCSGLTKRAYAQIGVTLIHQSAAQAQQGRPVAFTSEPIQPGDLVFLATRGNDVISHVGIALTQTTWIQARRPGDVVRVGPMPSLSSIVAVRRFV